MSVQDHLYRGQIQQFLHEIVDDVDKDLEKLDPPISYGADRYAHRTLLKMNLELIERLKESRSKVFTARIDWEDTNEGRETYYIGKHTIGRPAKVLSWASPFAQRLYTSPTDHHLDGSVQLILHLNVSKNNLLDIYNHYVDAKLEGELQQAQFTDSLLFNLLQGSRAQLRDIVATIQRQQYQIIQSPKDQLLIIQGAPGSGKTSIALHRIAYLLYNNRETLNASSMLVLVPNRMFLRHIAAILPALGERRVPQKTFDGWVLELLGTKIAYEPLEQALETFFDPARSAAEKALIARNARNKGSLQMKQMIDRHVSLLYEQVLDRATDLVFVYPDPERGYSEQARVTWKRDDVLAILENVRPLPYNERRDEIERRIARDVFTKLLSAVSTRIKNWRASDSHDELRKNIEKDVQKQIRQHFSSWHAQNVAQSYRQMLRTPHLVGTGIFSDDDLELFAFDAPNNQTPFRFSDLAGLLYLKIQLDGQDATTYDHIVVDEAQDVAPLLFHVLARYSRSSSLTVLGDIGQGIYAHHGIEDWSDLAEAVGSQTRAPQIMRESYRSTFQIITFANRMLQRIGANDHRAEPINRPGPEPSIHLFDDSVQLVANIANIVQLARANNNVSIAIVCKTMVACQEIDSALANDGLTNVQLLVNRDDKYEEGAVVMPSYLTKGMEFDIVIIADADSASYPPDALHVRLLYVAITRAAHALHLCCTGTLSPLLDDQNPLVPLQPVLNGAFIARSVTITDFIAEHPDVSLDWCVERLARADKLHLLRNGTIDSAVLELVLSTFTKVHPERDDESLSRPLNAEVQEVLRQYVNDLSMRPDTPLQNAFAFTQIAYGLLRNQMRSAGLKISDEGKVPLDEQVVLLTTLLQASRDGHLNPTAGRWTTRQSVLQDVDQQRQVTANYVLDQLLASGIIESKERAKRTEMRLGLEWIDPILQLGLGYRSDAWDTDLLERIPFLTEPLDWTTISIEVVS